MVFVPPLTSLGALVAETDGAQLLRGDASIPVRGIAHDSRRVAPGDLFVAIPGFARHGLEFARRRSPGAPRLSL